MPNDIDLAQAASDCAATWNEQSMFCRTEIDIPTASGPSDLTLELTVRQHDGGLVVEIDDLHVL